MATAGSTRLPERRLWAASSHLLSCGDPEVVVPRPGIPHSSLCLHRILHCFFHRGLPKTPPVSPHALPQRSPAELRQTSVHSIFQRASCLQAVPLQCLSQALTPPWVCVLKLESSQNPVLSGSGSLIGPSVGSWLRSGSLVASHTGLYPSWPGLSQSCLWLSPTALLLLCTDPRWGLAQRNPGTPPTTHYDDIRGSVVVEVPGGLCGKPVSRQALPAMHQRLRC